MKIKFSLLAIALVAGSVSISTWAQNDPTPTALGKEKSFDEFTQIQIKNFQDEPLGRIKDLGIDLINGRIVEVLIVSDKSLDVDAKIVAVPPRALIRDVANEVYRINVSTEVFKSAPAISLKHWNDAGRSERVAAAYYLFGQDPYFLEVGDTASKTASRPKVALGYVERSSKVVDLPVQNHEGHKFGKVWSMSLDIPNGRILNVIILAPGNFKTKSIVPAMALSFNPDRTGLLLDNTKEEFANEPRFVFTAAAYGQDDNFKREAYTGPRTSIALEQGTSYRDVDRTILIHQGIRASKIKGQKVEVGTIDGRVTLRGRVTTADDKRRIGEIAIAASRLELVDNQITVGQPTAKN